MKYLFWLMLFPALLFGQTKIDSLKISLATSKPEQAPYYLSGIGYQFLLAQHYDSALKYYYQVRIPHKDSVLTASTLNSMGVAYKQKGVYDSSIHYYQKALPLYWSLHDTAYAITVNTNLAIIYKNIGAYEKALEYALASITVLEKKQPDRILASGYNTVAEIFRTMEEEEEAYRYYQKALHTRKQIGFRKGEAQSFHNLGDFFLSIHKYDSAIANLQQSMQIKVELKDESAQANTLTVLGNVYIQLHQFPAAENYLMKAWRIKQKLNEPAEKATLLNSLGRLKLEQQELTEAGAFIKQAESLAREVGALSTLKDNLELNLQLAKRQGQYLKAVKYADELIKVKDSLLNKDKAESLIALQTRYETEKKEQHIKLLEQDKLVQQAEIKSKQSWIATLIITIVFVIVIALLLFMGYRISQRNRHKVEMLLKELHHRVKNNLQILSSILSLQSLHLTDADAIQAIKSSESRVNTMALIHKKLYKDESNRTIDIHEYITELSSFLLHSYGYNSQTLQLNITGEGIHIDVDKAIPIGLILNELISNALKYAYPEQANPRLDIHFQLLPSTELKIELRDNGKGMVTSETDDGTGSFGLKMVNTLIKELKGKITVAVQSGTAYTLQLPLHHG